MQAVAPLPLYVPGAQLPPHTLVETAVEYVPALQSAHVVVPDIAAYRPAAQLRHAVAPDPLL